MKINVASKNLVKIEAVRELIRHYDILNNSEVKGIKVCSNVSEEPKSLEETVQGAVNRAKESFKLEKCDYSFGIESGLMVVPQTKTGNMDICACAIYDGVNLHLGLSCAFEFPPVVTKMIHELDIDANEAFFKSGLTDNPKIGSYEGAIGLLTKGRITRKDYTKQAVQMALIHLEHPELYKI